MITIVIRRSLLGLIVFILAAALRPAAATPFIDVRTVWDVEFFGPTAPSNLSVTCGGTAHIAGLGCADSLGITRPITSDVTAGVSSFGTVTITNTGAATTSFTLEVGFSPFNPGGPEVGISIDNTSQSGSFSSTSSVFWPSSGPPGGLQSFTLKCSVPGVPGTVGQGNSFIFSPTTCGQRAPDETPFFPGFSLDPGGSITLDGGLSIDYTFSGIPEPSVLGLFAPAVLALGLLRRQRRLT
jgi:hypothetical protein